MFPQAARWKRRRHTSALAPQLIAGGRGGMRQLRHACDTAGLRVILRRNRPYGDDAVIFVKMQKYVITHETPRNVAEPLSSMAIQKQCSSVP